MLVWRLCPCVARVGLMHIGVFILLLLSGERNFGVRLNKPYSVRVPMDIPVFTGSHADFLIIVSHSTCTSFKWSWFLPRISVRFLWLIDDLLWTFCDGNAPSASLDHIWYVMLVWRKGNIKETVCATALCTIMMVHKGTSSSYRSVDCIGLWYCLV